MRKPLLTKTNFPTSLFACLGLATALTLLLDNKPAQAYNITSLIAQNPAATQATPQATQLYVNPVTGNDGSGNGSEQAPFKTITQALRMATTGTVIELAPGTYNAETGESFPIELKPGVIIQGDPATKGRNIVIRGGGFYLSRTFARQNIAVLGAQGAGLAGVTVTNPNRRGYGLWIESSSMVVADNSFIGNTHDGISVTGNGAPLIRNNYFADNGANGISIFNTARPEVRENGFERTGFGIAIGQNSAPIVVGNRISQNKDGIVVYGKAQPVLRNNTIEGNIRDGLVASQDSRPDVGTARQLGGNLFRNNLRYDINTTAANQTISAYGNQIARGRTAGRLDLGTGEQRSTGVSPVGALENYIQPSPRVNSPTSIEIPVPPPARATAPSNRVTRRPRGGRRAAAARRRNVRRLQDLPIAPSGVFQSPLSNARQLPPQRAAVEMPRPNRAPETPTPLRDRLPNLSVQPGVLPGQGQPSFERHPGNLPRVEIPSNSPRAVGEPLPPNSTAAVGQGYRVVVLLETLEQERLLRQLVPDAVRVRSLNRMVMQVGVFRDRSSAEQMLQKMSGNGLNAMLEEL
ncbi:DUF1565 domain-containing protein [Microseira wollei]|nr:DUF1565 domain-containing protein [Microseira wollei]